MLILMAHCGVRSWCFLARLLMFMVGSDPMDSRQIMGTRIFDSSDHIISISSITPSAYFTPIDSAMYLRAWADVLSGHHDLRERERTRPEPIMLPHLHIRAF